MKSLKNVQIIAKVMKILSMIAFVASIIACALCAISIPIVAVLGKDPQIIKMVGDFGETYDVKKAICICVCGMIESGFMIALYACVVRFYKKELAIGTPFDKEIVKKSRVIGWLYIILILSSAIVVGIVSLCFHVAVEDTFTTGNLIVGVVYLLLSFVFAYGAELQNEKEQQTEPEQEKIKEETNK